jgi:hypothetical protein
VPLTGSAGVIDDGRVEDDHELGDGHDRKHGVGVDLRDKAVSGESWRTGFHGLHAWALAEVQSQLALDAWMRAARHLKADAFAVYRAALDREKQAAAVLAARAAMTAQGVIR